MQNNVAATNAYDQLHVNAFLDYLDVTVPEHSEGNLNAIPALFGGNFQSGEPSRSLVESTAFGNTMQSMSPRRPMGTRTQPIFHSPRPYSKR